MPGENHFDQPVAPTDTLGSGYVGADRPARGRFDGSQLPTKSNFDSRRSGGNSPPIGSTRSGQCGGRHAKGGTPPRSTDFSAAGRRRRRERSDDADSPASPQQYDIERTAPPPRRSDAPTTVSPPPRRDAASGLKSEPSPTQVETHRLLVSIFSAQGLSDSDSRARPRCVCSVLGRGAGSVQTQAWPSSHDPVTWNHEQELPAYTPSDDLEFSVVADVPIQEYLKGVAARSRKQAPDDLIGKALLKCDQFFPFGFDGELTVSCPGRGIRGLLRVRVTVGDEDGCSAARGADYKACGVRDWSSRTSPTDAIHVVRAGTYQSPLRATYESPLRAAGLPRALALQQSAALGVGASGYPSLLATEKLRPRELPIHRADGTLRAPQGLGGFAFDCRASRPLTPTSALCGSVAERFVMPAVPAAVAAPLRGENARWQ